MSVTVKHNFESEQADSGDATLVQPSHWNADHAVAMSAPGLVGRTADGAGAADVVGMGVGMELENGKVQMKTKMLPVPASRAIAATDFERELSCASGIALTVLTDAGFSIVDPVGEIFTPTLIFYVAGAAPPTLVTTGLTIRNATPTMVQYRFYALKRVGPDEWAWL